MSAGTHGLAPFQPVLDRLNLAREHTDQLGGLRGDSDSLEARQNAINFEVAKEQEADVVAEVVDEFIAADDTVLDVFQKAIAVKVLAHPWRTPMDESLGLVNAGFQVLENIKEGARQNRGTIAILGESSIALYESFGLDDLQTEPVRGAKGHHSIVYKLSNGQSIVVEDIEDDSFPDPNIAKVHFSKTGLTTGGGNNVPELLRTLDPRSDTYALPFVRLGSAEQPKDRLDDHLKTDAQRFAGRLLVWKAGKETWIQIASPSDALKATVVDRFSDIYLDLLSGDTPRDAVAHIGSSHSEFTGRTNVYATRSRKTSLASHSPQGRGNIFYAASISESEVEAATREKVAKLEETKTPNGVIKALRAKQLMDAFFVRVTES